MKTTQLITVFFIGLIGISFLQGGENQFIQLDTYVVTGTKTVHRLDQAPVRTELISSMEMELTACKSFADAVELIPGIRVENNCQNCGTSEVLLLGLEGKYTSLLVDGTPMYSSLANVYGIDQIPSLFIDRIEVVKGAGSSVYGGGAVGGIVNIIARTPVKSGAEIEYRYDSVKGETGHQISFLFDWVNDDQNDVVSIYALHSKSDAVDLNADGFSDLTEKELVVTGLRWLHQFEKHSLRIDYNRTKEYRRGGDQFSLPDYRANISERIDTLRDSARVSWTGILSPDFDFQLNAGFAYIDRETYYGGLFGNTASDALFPESLDGLRDNDQVYIDRGYHTFGEVAKDQYGFTQNWVYNIDFNANYTNEKHHTSIGLQYYSEKIDDIVPVSSFVAEYPIQSTISKGNNIGGYIQDDWHFLNNWELLTGIRFDKHSELKSIVFSPRLSLRFEPRKNLVYRLTIGTGFSPPQPFDEDLHIELIAGERSTTRQRADIKEEKSYSGLFSMLWSPNSFDGKLTVESNLFYTALQDTFTKTDIQNDPDTNEAFRERYNGPDAEIGGIEFNLGMIPFKSIRVDIGYIHQVARFKEPVMLFQGEEGQIVEEKNFLEKPNDYGVLQISYTGSYNFSVSAIYTGKMKEMNERTGKLNTSTPSFLVFNTTLSRTFNFDLFPDLEITTGIKNITDDRQKDLESGVDRDPYYLYGPRTPRTYFIQGSLKF